MNSVRTFLYTVCVATAVGTAPAGEPPAPPHRSDVQRVLSAARGLKQADAAPRPLRVVLVADRKDHGPGEHDYPRWQSRWALLLGGSAASAEKAANLFGPDRLDPAVMKGAENVRVHCVQQWPDVEQWKKADLVVVFCYISWSEERLEQVQRFLERGGGIVLIHSATWTKPEPSADVAAAVGVGGFQRYRHGSLTLEIVDADHPICLGLPSTVRLDDESYWPPSPPRGSSGIQILAGSREQADSDGTASSLQPMFWTFELGKGRVFGCVPGHNNWTFDHPYFRLLLLRGMAWAAHETPYRFDDLALRSAAIADP